MGALRFLNNEKELIKLSREGIEKNTFNLILQETGLTLKEMSDFIHLTSRTIQLKKDKDRLPANASEKVLFIARLYKRGQEVFGDDRKFRKWMCSENVAMGGVEPKSYLDTFQGIQLLMDELIAIEHGFVV